MTMPQYRRSECTIDGRLVLLRGPLGGRGRVARPWPAKPTLLCEFLSILLAAGPRWIDNGEVSEAIWGPEWQGDTARVLSVLTVRIRDFGIILEVVPRPYGDYYGTLYRIPIFSRGGVSRVGAVRPLQAD